MFQTFTVHFDQGKLLFIGLCHAYLLSSTATCGNMYGYLLGAPRLAVTQRRMDGLRFYALFNTISGISGRWVGNNDRLCAMEKQVYD